MVRKSHGVDLRTMSDGDLDALLKDIMMERTSRAVSFGDPEVLATRALSKGFTITGEPIPPQDMGNGVIAITGVVKDTSAVKHRCHLYSMRVGTEEQFEEYWVWDENASTWMYSETAKVESVRRTVALHAPPDNSLLLQHSMVWDGTHHERKSLTVYQIQHHADPATGEILSTEFVKMTDPVIKRLPPPPGSEM